MMARTIACTQRGPAELSKNEPEQLAFLAAHGCEQAQGYLFSRPLAALAFEQWMTGRGRCPRPAPALT